MNFNAVSGYVERQRDISFQTSSGDKISINLLKKDSAEAYSMNDGGNLSGEFSFSSLERFSFNVEGNGLTEQDHEEIAQMMEKIQPLIDEFFNQELETPYNELVNQISAPIKELETSAKELAKSMLVDSFDKKIAEQKPTEESAQEKKVETFQQFLEDILYKIENKDNYFYA